MDRSKAGTKKKEVPTAYHILIKYNNNKHIIVFNKIWKKYNEIKLTKNKMDLNNRKMDQLRGPIGWTNYPPSPFRVGRMTILRRLKSLVQIPEFDSYF